MKSFEYLENEYAAHTWVALDRKRQRRPIAVIPSGAIEVYGPHLPLGSDSYVAEAIALRVAREIDGLCLPPVPVGYSADLMSFPGTLTVKPEAFVAYLDGICRSLVNWGMKKFLFINTHLGNVALIDQAADGLIRECGASCLQIDWWRYASRICRDLFDSGDWAVGHAGELGTSVLLYLANLTVALQAVQDFVPDTNPWPSGLIPYISYRDVTPSGVMGYPSAGSYQQGEKVVTRCVGSIAGDARKFFADSESKEG